jgi:hypothetical protein
MKPLRRLFLACVLSAPSFASAAVWTCITDAIMPLSAGSISTGSCKVASGTYTTNGDGLGAAGTSTIADTATVLCGAPTEVLQHVVTGIARPSTASAVAYTTSLDLSTLVERAAGTVQTLKLQMYTASATPGTNVPLAELANTTAITNYVFHFIAFCK